MRDRESNILNMFIATREFNAVNLNDYRNLPDAAAQFAIVTQAIDTLETFAADQGSGSRGQAVEQKSVVRAAMRRKMKDLSRTARALNIDDPGFRRLFRVPDDNSDQKLLAAAREFVEEGNRFKADLMRLGIPATFIDELNDDINTLERAIAAKAQANTETVGATAGIDDEIERGMDAEEILDAILKNVYRSNPVKLAEWMSARHVKRSPKKSIPTPTT